jgi:hypothetical protein
MRRYKINHRFYHLQHCNPVCIIVSGVSWIASDAADAHMRGQRCHTYHNYGIVPQFLP